MSDGHTTERRMGYTRCSQIFQKSRSHLHILGDRKATCSNFHTEVQNFSVTFEPHCYLALSVLCMWTNTRLYVTGRGGGGCNNYAENIRHHHTKFNHMHPSSTKRDEKIGCNLVFLRTKAKKSCIHSAAQSGLSLESVHAARLLKPQWYEVTVVKKTHYFQQWCWYQFVELVVVNCEWQCC